jgi:hypothetical protein
MKKATRITTQDYSNAREGRTDFSPALAGPHFVLPKARLAEELARSGESFNKF